MYINELSVGSIVYLEIVKDSSVYEVSTIVEGVSLDVSSEKHVLLRPFKYKGKVLDLGDSSFDKVNFNVYALDEKGIRICWMDVKLNKREFKGNVYYAVTPHLHHALSVQNDRRDTERLEILTAGSVIIKNERREIPVSMMDISSGGVSFKLREDLELLNKVCRVCFNEEVNGKEYDLKIDCKCVRKQLLPDGGYHYGCSINNASNQMLTYVFIKKIMANNPDLGLEEQDDN